MLTDTQIAGIRESVDLVALISEYVPLRRQGARFVGLCPFHQEKTPSFGVSRGKSFYYCFGCQASGDAISFLRHVEGLSFGEALTKLAERVGIDLPEPDDASAREQARARARREALQQVMLAAQSFFEEQLHCHPHASLARDELERRGVQEAVAQRFKLGYAPLAWDALARHLADRQLSMEAAQATGLIAPRRQGGGYYDRFRHRLMFPVIDQHGRTLAFSGRALSEPAGVESQSAPAAKYINSPEGPLYKKGQVLFGLAQARSQMRKLNQAILCEGNFDVLALHQAGFEQAVAPLGTAFTIEQARLLRRFVEEAVVVFDGDGAGRKATRAAFELLETAGIRSRAVRLPDGGDPDSLLRERGPELVGAWIEASEPLLDFIIDDAREAAPDPSGRAQAIRALGPLLARVASPVERRFYLEKIAQKFDIHDLSSVRQELIRGTRESRRGASNSLSTPAAPAPQGGARQVRSQVRAVSDLPERQCLVLGAILDCPQLLRRPEAQALAQLLTDADLQSIFTVTTSMFEELGKVDAPRLLEETASNPARAWLADRLSSQTVYDENRAEQVFLDGLPWLEKDLKRHERERLKREIQLAFRNRDSERAAALIRRRDELAK